MTTKAVPNGSADAPVVQILPPVVGINFGNSFASIAVFTKVKDAVVFFCAWDVVDFGDS